MWVNPVFIIRIDYKGNGTSNNKMLQSALHEKTGKYTCDPPDGALRVSAYRVRNVIWHFKSTKVYGYA